MIRIVAAIFPLMLLAGCMSQQPVPSVDRPGSTARAGAPLPSGPGYYTVKRGDTLYRIALDNGVDHRDIATWNNITNPSAIKEGQVLRVAPPGAAAVSTDGAVTRPIALDSAIESRSLDQPAGSVVPIPQSSSLKHEPRVGKEPYSDEAYARLNKSGIEPVKPEAIPESITSVSGEANRVVWEWPNSGRVVRSFGESGSKGLDIVGKLGDQVYAAADGKVIYVGEALPGYGKLIIIKHGDYNSVYAHNSKFIAKDNDVVKRGQKIAEMGNSGTDTVKLHFEIRKQGKPVDPAQYLPKR